MLRGTLMEHCDLGHEMLLCIGDNDPLAAPGRAHWPSHSPVSIPLIPSNCRTTWEQIIDGNGTDYTNEQDHDQPAKLLRRTKGHRAVSIPVSPHDPEQRPLRRIYLCQPMCCVTEGERAESICWRTCRATVSSATPNENCLCADTISANQCAAQPKGQRAAS